MRSPALACLVALAFCPLVPAQSGPTDDLWFAGATPQRIDRFGSLLGSPGGPPAPVVLRRSPTGEVWSLTNPLVPAQLALLDAGGNPLGTWQLGTSASDVIADAAGNAWVSLGNSTVESRDRAGNVLGSFTIPGPGGPMALDETGRLWVAVRNQPGALLSWRMLAGGTVSNVGLPLSIGQVVDVVLDGRPGGSHAWVIGDGSREVVELDRQGSVVATITLPPPAGPVSELTQLACAPDGTVWVAAEDGLWSIDPVARTARQVWFQDVHGVTLDAKGELWFVSLFDLVKLDLAAGRPQFLSHGLWMPSTCDDAAGLTLARLVDRGGDFDGDGFANGVEVDSRTNPFDALSSPRLEFHTTRLENAPGDDVEFVARGDLGWGFVLFGVPPMGPPVTIPGIDGALLLQNVVPVNLPMPVPGRTTLRVPLGQTLAPAALQLLRLPLGTAAPRLSEFALVRFATPGTGSLTERFDSAIALDAERSSGGWGQGVARAGPLGGVGRLGSFDHTVGTEVSPGVFEFSTDGQVFPASHTLFGRVETVTDGVFEFTDLIVPAGVTVRFVGSNPAVVRVRGTARIDGVLDVSGDDVPGDYNAVSQSQPAGSRPVGRPGQPGSAGGASAGRGGDGGEGCDGLGTGNGRFQGQPGGDLVAPMLSGYSGAVVGTGGRGGPLWPVSGLRANVTYNLFFSITGQVGSGGGGGSYLVSGGAGRVIQTFTGVAADAAPNTLAGATVGFRPQPGGASALDHFLLGGSGGGGGGSHPLNMSSTEINGAGAVGPRAWHAGAGGAGGGGAIGLRVGRDLVFGTQAEVRAHGGSAAEYLTQILGPPMPGGGGSGGSVVLQVGGTVQQAGSIDLGGGSGGRIYHRQFNAQFVDAVGGDGAPGYVRLETAGGATVPDLGTVVGPTLGMQNVGVLRDVDVLAGQVSKFYSPGAYPPRWLDYTMRVLVNGVPIDFSDDPASFHPAVGPGVPVQLFLQVAPVDSTGRTLGDPGPWRSFTTDLSADRGNGIRFMLLFDRTIAQDIAVDELQISFR